MIKYVIWAQPEDHEKAIELLRKEVKKEHCWKYEGEKVGTELALRRACNALGFHFVRKQKHNEYVIAVDPLKGRA